ncbi:MAG TPA: alpha/beta fold hydrolase [Spongiibacteraceae bacterium]|jgi:pimeloyl-ACP methyl ester carboxylesterase
MKKIRRFRRTINLINAIPDINNTAISVDVIVPEPDQLAADPVILFCAPGGGMSGLYYDLGDDANRDFSFAQAMAARGWIVVAIDPLGGGRSSAIDDGYLLHPARLAAAHNAAITALKKEFAEGFENYPALKNFMSVGVGHSMGGMIVSWVQAHFTPYDAVIILGSGPYGLYEHLSDDLRPLANEPQRARDEIVERLRANGTPPFAELKSNEKSRAIFRGGNATALAYLRNARIPIFLVPGSFVMIPGSWAPEAERINVPVLLMYGDTDICTAPHNVPAYFKNSADITVVILPDTGHSHFVFPTIAHLTARVGTWIGAQQRNIA